MSAGRYVHIELDLQREAEPLAGLLRTEHGEPLAFTGVLELMGLIDQALAEGEGRGEERKTP